MPPSDDISQLLVLWSDGDRAARDALLDAAYQQLKRIAQRRMRSEADGASLQTTGLVHEAYLRMAAQDRARWKNRAQFFAIAARIMRRILVERWRARHALKRGGLAVTLAEEAGGVEEHAGTGAASGRIDVERLHLAIERLALQDDTQARVVELRFFGGLTIEETGLAVGISPATVKREWAMARAWLKRELAEDLP